MKKLFILVLSLFIITGCSNSSIYEQVGYKEDVGYEGNVEATYKFTGVSEHFLFETGKVYYGENNERYILIKNFNIYKSLKKQDDIVSYFIDLSFDDNSMFGGAMTKINNDFKTELSDYTIEENGIYNQDGYGQSDPFLETPKSLFKKSIKMKIKYCYNTNECNEETFKLYYTER